MNKFFEIEATPLGRAFLPENAFLLRAAFRLLPTFWQKVIPPTRVVVTDRNICGQSEFRIGSVARLRNMTMESIQVTLATDGVIYVHHNKRLKDSTKVF